MTLGRIRRRKFSFDDFRARSANGKYVEFMDAPYRESQVLLSVARKSYHSREGDFWIVMEKSH